MAKGSYDFGSLEGSQSELLRLEKQAQLVADLEGKVLNEHGVKDASHILELGCGPGFVTSLLKKLVPESTILAIDYSSELLQKLQNRISGAGTDIHPILANGEVLPLKDGWADFIYSRFVMQHVPSPQTVIDEQHRILAPGGRLCVVDSDDGLLIHHPPEPKIEKLLSEAREKQQDYGGDRHIGRKLPSLFSSAGFEEIHTQVVYVTQSQIPFDMLSSIAFGYKASLTGSTTAVPQIVENLAISAENGNLFLGTGVVVCSGKKKYK